MTKCYGPSPVLPDDPVDVSCCPTLVSRWETENASVVGRNDASPVSGAKTITGVTDPWGVAGGVLTLNGSSDFLSVAADADFLYNTGDFTLEAWIRPHEVLGSNYRTILGNSVSNNCELYVQAGNLAFYVDGTHYYTAPLGSTLANTWHHVAVCRQGDNLYLLQNGAVLGTTTGISGLSIGDASNALYVGNFAGSSYFLGEMSDVRVSNTARYTDAYTLPSRFIPDVQTLMLLACQGADTGVIFNDSIRLASVIYDSVGTDHFTQSTKTQKPTLGPDRVNYLPVLYVDGSSDEMSSAFAIDNGFTFVAVVKPSTETGVQAVLSDGTNWIGFNSGKPACNFGALLQADASAKDFLGVLAVVVNGTESRIYWNRTLVAMGNTGANNLGAAALFAKASASYATGFFAEAEVYDGPLSITQAQTRSDELITKYNIPVAITLPAISTYGLAGTTWTITNGTWNLSHSYTYQWYADSVLIPGATASTYIMEEKHETKSITCRIIADGFNYAESGAVQAWTPSLMSTHAWWDASKTATITQVAGKVSQIDDRSGNSRHLVQAVALNQPTTGIRTLASKNVLDHDGSDWMQTADIPFPASGNLQTYMVAVVDSVDSSTDAVFGTTDSGAIMDFDIRAANSSAFNGSLYASNLGGDAPFSNPPYPGPSIYNANFNWTAGIKNAYVTGSNVTGNTTYNAKFSATAKFNAFAKANNAAQKPDGAWAETLLVESTSDATRQQVEGYLAWKWGLQANLPWYHPFKSAPPAAVGTPVNTALPVITAGGYVGSTWSVSNGTWTGASSFTYQWYADDAEIVGAVSNTYVMTSANSGKAIRCKVTPVGYANQAVVSNAVQTWIPARITTEAWYDASDTNTITAAGGSVSQWNDKSGNVNHVTQPTAANQPKTGLNTMNGLNVLTLQDGIAQTMQKTGANISLANNDFAAFIVYDWTSVTTGNGSGILQLKNSVGLQVCQLRTNDGTLFYPSWETTDGSPAYLNPPYPDAAIFSIQNDVVGQIRQGYHNGTLDTNVDNSFTGFGFDTIVLGQSSQNRRLSGLVAEILLIDDVTVTTRQKVEGYLAWKWGLQGSLPAAHPFKATFPMV